MIDPQQPDADLAWLQSWRGIDRGIADLYAARIQARLDQAGWDRDTAVASAAAAWRAADRADQRAQKADARIDALRAAVQARIDDPANASLADVVDAIAALLEVKPREGAAT